MTSCMLYDRHLSPCMLWAYSRSGIHGCTVTRAGNGIFLIQHKLHLVLRGSRGGEGFGDFGMPGGGWGEYNSAGDKAK